MGGSKAFLFVALLGLALSAQAAPPDRASEAVRHYRAGVESMRSEAWDAAADEFRAAIAADPNMALAHYNLGQCRMAQKRYVEAVAAYRNAKEAFTRTAQLSDQDREARERQIQDEIRGLRDNLDQLHMVKDGSAERRTVEIETRIHMLESMRMKNGRAPEIPAEFPLALGSAYFRQQKLDEARTEYREATRLNPNLGAAHNNLAVIELLTGHPREAQTELDLARKSGFRTNPQLESDIKKAVADAKTP